jgi:hypothetical protein
MQIAPVSEAVPARHSEHAGDPAGDDVPGAHVVQLVDPASAAKVPAAQAVQPPAFATDEYVPGVQAVQVVSAVALQAVATADPGSQVVHALQRLPLRYEPVGQLVQVVALPLQVAQLASHAMQTRSLVAMQPLD